LLDQLVIFAPLLGGGSSNETSIHPYEHIYNKRMLLLKNNIQWERISKNTRKNKIK
jgi:hypothetical protein